MQYCVVFMENNLVEGDWRSSNLHGSGFTLPQLSLGSWLTDMTWSYSPTTYHSAGSLDPHHRVQQTWAPAPLPGPFPPLPGHFLALQPHGPPSGPPQTRFTPSQALCAGCPSKGRSSHQFFEWPLQPPSLGSGSEVALDLCSPSPTESVLHSSTFPQGLFMISSEGVRLHVHSQYC